MITIETILLRAVISILVLGSVAGLILGATLILRPHGLARVNLIANRWISTRHIDRFLETAINFDSLFYRYRLASSLVALAGAIYILYYFGVQIDRGSVTSTLATRFHIPAVYVSVMFGPIQLIAILGAAFTLFASLFVLFLPGQFRKFEHGANEWVSLRHAMKPLEILRTNVDEFTLRHTLPIGVMLVLCSVYTFALLTFWAS
jgi:hypothetical protein